MLFHAIVQVARQPIPFFENGEFKGAFVPHANIRPMLEDSIDRSEVKMLAIHDDSTLIGMNQAAETAFDLKPYRSRRWEDISQAVPYVRNELDLMRCPSEDFVWLADGIKWQSEFDLDVEGTRYKVLKERVPEIGMNLIALSER